MTNKFESVDERLTLILDEMSRQDSLSILFPDEGISFQGHIDQFREYIEVGEPGLAYEGIVSLLDGFPFKLSPRCKVALDEVERVFSPKPGADDESY